MMRIVAIGECMVELSPLELAEVFQLSYAGDTLNTAWYLRRLLKPKYQIEYFTAVGSDLVSDQMLNFFKRSGIETENILRRHGKSVGLYMIRLYRGERSFTYWRSNSAAQSLASAEMPLQTSLARADLAYFSGITLAILPLKDRKTLMKVLHDFRRQGGIVAFDPNLRPTLWNSTEDMTQVVMKAAAISDIVLPSYEDEAKWYGDKDLSATVDRYTAVKVKCCVVKNGPGRILAFNKGQYVSYDPIKNLKVIDTTAAGDSFNAGFIAAHLQGSDLFDAVQAGSSLAEKVIEKSGALVDLDFKNFLV